MGFRAGGPGDAEALCDLTATVWRTAYTEILDEATVEEHLAETNDPETVRKQFEEYDLTAFVAGDPIVGAAFCLPAEDEDRLHRTTLYVHSDRWGEGIGSGLLSRVEEEAVERERDAVVLVVLDANDRVRAFYERHGYEAVGEREESIDEGVREQVYETEL